MKILTVRAELLYSYGKSNTSMLIVAFSNCSVEVNKR